MYKIFCIVLFITIFCNGVTHSSPTKTDVIESDSKERQVSTEIISTTDHRTESNIAAPDNGTHHIETPTVETSSSHLEADNKSTSGNSTLEKITSHGSIIKNDTQNITVVGVKTPNASSNNSTTTSINSNSTANIPTAVPVNKSTPTDLPPRKFSDMPRPIVAGKNTTTVSTFTVGTNTTALVTKPVVTTQTPMPSTSAHTDNVLLEHSSSSKTEENRFDGASFVGGIVLTVGLTAIGFIAFKYYKSGKIDANYRTL